MFLAFEGHVPSVGDRVFVDGSARVIGKVVLGDDVAVLPCAVVRGDYDEVRIGKGSVVEDSCVLHADAGGLELGERVVVGHAAVVHCSKVGDGTLIGMGATVLKDAVIGAGCLVAAGALVTEGMLVPAGSLVMGVPGRVVRPVSDAQREYLAFAADYYRDWAESCRAGNLVEVQPRRLSALESKVDVR